MDPTADQDLMRRRRILRQALSVAFGIAPFGVVFGVACADAGLTWADAAGFSVLTFAGSSQFAAVGVLGDGGTAMAAIGAGLLLNVRSLAFGILLAPTLRGPVWKRGLLAQLVIDESTAVATAQDEPRWRRAGFLAAGLAVFVVWNITTLMGVTLASVGDDFITDWGLDAAAPAAFLALLWPRLSAPVTGRSPDGTPDRVISRDGLGVAVAGAAIAALAIPWTPPGIPILLAGIGVFAARPRGSG